MKIKTITLQNFRCFGPIPQTINLSETLTVFVGTNGAGKTAALLALLRMFGISEEQRRIRRDDFHVPYDEKMTIDSREFVIEVLLTFPELSGGEEARQTVPVFFNQLFPALNGEMICRFRLEARWVNDGSLDGSIDSKLYAVTALSGLDPLEERHKIKIQPHQRSAIQVLYIPATRDGATQVGQLLRGRLWRAIKWGEETKVNIEKLGQEINQHFSGEPSVQAISEALTTRWHQTHGTETHRTPTLQPLGPGFETLVRKIGVSFFPNGGGRECGIDDLSDGQRSLFHLALTTAMLDVETAILKGEHGCAFNCADSLPRLTIIALEEPENCLSPYYLSRILNQVRILANQNGAQAIVSSHSASILERIDPEVIRYFRLNERRNTQVKELTLPSNKEDAGKYTREAIRAYPELYFASFVIFGEGPSEGIIISSIAKAMNLPIDRLFVPVVPLGGRHVNHFWRLVNDLGIPHATLLDFDLGRKGGGWGRIHYVLEQLISNGHPIAGLLTPLPGVPHEDALIAIKNTNYSASGSLKFLEEYISFLENKNIFFSRKLDIDWMMLKAFPQYYQKLEEGESGPNVSGEMNKPKITVLGSEDNLSLYDEADEEFFSWYRYLFLNRSKPSTHLRALSLIPSEELQVKAPEVLKKLLTHIASTLPTTVTGPPDAIS